METMNQKDLMIINRLDNNSRESYADIGKKVHLTREAVSAKVNKLIETGVITRFYTAIDLGYLGNITLQLLIKYNQTTPKIEKNIIDYLNKNEKIRVIIKCEEVFDLYVSFFAKNKLEIFQEITKLKDKFGQNIIIKEIIQPVQEISYNRKYLNPANPPKIRKKYICEIKKLNNGQEKILNTLIAYPRASLVEIFKKTNISVHKIKKIIEYLEKENIITGYGITINLDKLCFQRHKVLISFTDTKELKNLERFAEKHPNITYFGIFIGHFEALINIECKDIIEYSKIINDLKKAIHYKINDAIYYVEKQHIKHLF
jgi:Lrp/AsnC family leucine-responsive transcriptional regulator